MNESKANNQKIEELLLLQRSSQKINSILDLDILLEEIVNDVGETFGYLRTGVLLKDDQTNELVIAAVRGWTKNFHVKGDRFKVGEYGIIGHVGKTCKTYYAPDVTVDPYYQVSEESTRSEVDIPLIIKNKLIGVFSVQHHEANAFSNDRIQMLESLASNMAIAIENARLFLKEKLERERIENELKDARNIQFHLIPQKSPEADGFNITGICLPSLEAGGDWFDYIPFNDGRIGIVLADVSGKGMGAAMLMSSTRSILRLIANSEATPGAVLNRVNEVLIQDFPTTKFVTMIYAILNPMDKSILISNAGHLPPVLTGSDGTKFIETESGLPLGISDSVYSEFKIDLSKGEKIIFYSDGVTEAMDKNEEQFGEERLIKIFHNRQITVDDIVKKVQQFAGSNLQSDDITVVMIETLE